MKSSCMRMSSSCFLQMIGLVLIAMNVLTAFAGMQHHTEEEQHPTLLSISSSSQHRELQSESIDYSGCYMDLSNADENHNGFIEQQEYYTFLELYGKRVCSIDTTVTLQQKSTFYTLACLCKQMDSTGTLNDQAVLESDQCCLGNNAKLYTARDPITLEPIPVPALTMAQKEYFKTICFYTDASIPSSSRDCSTTSNNEDDQGEDFPIDDSGTDEDQNTDVVEDEEDNGDDDSSPDDDNEEEQEDDTPKGTAACRFKSISLLDDGSLTLRHYSDPIEESITIQLIYNGIGWLGFGFTDINQEAKMIHNFGVIGLPDENVRKVQQYDMTGRSITGVTPTPIQSLIRSTMTQNGDQTVLTFTQAAAELGNIYDGTFQFIYAVGRNNELSYHTYRGSGREQYAVCDVLLPPPTNNNETETTVNTTERITMAPTRSPTTGIVVPTIVSAPVRAPVRVPTTESNTIRSPTKAPSRGVGRPIITTPTGKVVGVVAPTAPSVTVPTIITIVAPTATPTKQPHLRGTNNGNNNDEDDEGKTAKDLIESFLNGHKENDDTEIVVESPTPPKPEVDDDDKDDDTSGMASFIRWLRIIWQFSKTPVIGANEKDDR